MSIGKRAVTLLEMSKGMQGYDVLYSLLDLHKCSASVITQALRLNTESLLILSNFEAPLSRMYLSKLNKRCAILEA